MNKNTKTYNWSNSRGDKLVYTVELAWELDNSGKEKINHPGRRIVESLSVNGKTINNGWLKALDNNHPQYAMGVRGVFGDYGMLDKDYTACLNAYKQVMQTDEYVAYKDALNRSYDLDYKHKKFMDRVEEMSAMGDK